MERITATTNEEAFSLMRTDWVMGSESPEFQFQLYEFLGV